MVLELDERLYAMKAVETTLSEYEGLARFSIKRQDGKILVSIDAVDADFEPAVFTGEFGNRVLAEMA